MEPPKGERPLLAIHLDLTTLRPTPERLRRLVAAFGRWGYDGVYLEWGDGFPWTIDERIRGVAAYSEELVAGLHREAIAEGVALNAFLPASLDFVARIPVYRHLFRWERRRPLLDLDSPGGRKFFSDLAEDFLALVPAPVAVMLDCTGARVTPAGARFMAEAFHEQRVQLHFGDADGWPGEAGPELASFFDAVAFPITAAGPHFRRPDGRVIHAVRAFIARERRLAGELARASAPGSEPPSLLLSFQPPEGRDVEVLRGSIEPSLAAARVLAAQLRGTAADGGCAEVDESTRAAERARELERLLDSGWRRVRVLRQHLAEHATGGGGDPHLLTVSAEELARLDREARRVAGELTLELGGRVEAEALDRRLRGALFPLYEEYHALLPRIELSAEGPEWKS